MFVVIVDIEMGSLLAMCFKGDYDQSVGSYKQSRHNSIRSILSDRQNPNVDGRRYSIKPAQQRTSRRQADDKQKTSFVFNTMPEQQQQPCLTCNQNSCRNMAESHSLRKPATRRSLLHPWLFISMVLSRTKPLGEAYFIHDYSYPSHWAWPSHQEKLTIHPWLFVSMVLSLTKPPGEAYYPSMIIRIHRTESHHATSRSLLHPWLFMGKDPTWPTFKWNHNYFDPACRSI